MAIKKIQPILIIYFNRPQHLKSLLLSLKSFSPGVIYFACDGPRVGNQSDSNNIKKCNDLIDDIVDWNCNKYFLKSAVNRGCDDWVPKSISWLFKHETSGIILEDDCLIDNNFYEFSGEMLEKHANNKKIMNISALNPLAGDHQCNADYFLSCYPLTWAWATWRRAWQNYQDEVSYGKYIKHIANWLRSNNFNKEELKYWRSFIQKLEGNEVHFWDAKWIYSIWLKNSYSITPNSNLVKNIGFGADATHTKFSYDIPYAKKIKNMNFPLIHPSLRIIDSNKDRKIFEVRFKSTFKKKLLHVFTIFLKSFKC